MLRLVLPAISCAVLLWFSSDVGPTLRAQRNAGSLWQALLPPTAPPRAHEDVSAQVEEALARVEASSAVESDAAETRSAAPAVRRQHDVRDLVALGFTVDSIALWTQEVCKDAEVTPRVNVVELVAPEEAQLGYEHLLDQKRAAPYVLRIHPVADLVCTPEELAALQNDFDVELCGGGYDPPDAGDPVDPENEPEPTSPFDIDSLAEVISATIQGVGAIHASGRNLVALAGPTAQVEIARFLDNLRSNGDQDAGPPTGPEG